MATEYAHRQAKRLYSLSKVDVTGDYVKFNGQRSIKAEWLDTGASVARALLKELSLTSVKVLKNRGGPAVSGEVFLEGVSQSGKAIEGCLCGPPHFDGEPKFYMRTAPNGTNTWFAYRELAASLEDVARQMKIVFRLGD